MLNYLKVQTKSVQYSPHSNLIAMNLVFLGIYWFPEIEYASCLSGPIGMLSQVESVCLIARSSVPVMHGVCRWEILLFVIPLQETVRPKLHGSHGVLSQEIQALSCIDISCLAPNLEDSRVGLSQIG